MFEFKKLIKLTPLYDDESIVSYDDMNVNKLPSKDEIIRTWIYNYDDFIKQFPNKLLIDTIKEKLFLMKVKSFIKF